MLRDHFQKITTSLRGFAVLGLCAAFLSACNLSGTDSDDDSLTFGVLAAVGAAPLVSAATSAANATITMFSTSATTGTAIGGRTGADSICSSNVPSGTTCTNVRAFISVTSTDEIQDMPTNYSVPTSRPIVSTGTTVIATSWSDALDGTIQTSLDSAGVFSTTASNYWTGSNGTGGIASTAGTCNNWNTGAGVTGARGQSDQTDSDWIGLDENLGLGNFCGDTSVRLICICWN